MRTSAKAAAHPVGLIVLIGLTWAFFQHLLSGVRHLVMDSGAGFELDTNKRFAVLTLAGSLFLTLLVWIPNLGSNPMSLGESATPLGKVDGLGSAHRWRRALADRTGHRARRCCCSARG